MDPEESRENSGAAEEKGGNSVNKKSFETMPIKTGRWRPSLLILGDSNYANLKEIVHDIDLYFLSF